MPVLEMETVNIHQPETRLSRLIEKAAKGVPFIIAKAGKPLVKVIPLDAPTRTRVKRTGFLEGEFSIPDDFDRMGSSEIDRCSKAMREAASRYASAALGSQPAGPTPRSHSRVD